MNNIYLDIETIPNQSPEYRAEVRKNITAPAQYKKPESIAAWIEENGDSATDEIVAKTSFDPALGHICCIGMAGEVSDPTALRMTHIDDEASMLCDFFNSLPKLGLNRFIGHYISVFDLRFILCRAIVLGVRLPAKTLFPRDIKPWSDEVFDTMVAWCGPRDRISLDNLCRALNVPSPKTDFDGSMVADAWAKGQHTLIADYCMSDVEAVRNVHRKFEAAGY